MHFTSSAKHFAGLADPAGSCEIHFTRLAVSCESRETHFKKLAGAGKTR
jgi:hypothetical protein